MWLIYKLIYKLNTRRTGSTKGYSEYKEETQTANQAEQAVQHNRKWRETEAMNTQRENGVKEVEISEAHASQITLIQIMRQKGK